MSEWAGFLGVGFGSLTDDGWVVDGWMDDGWLGWLWLWLWLWALGCMAYPGWLWALGCELWDVSCGFE